MLEIANVLRSFGKLLVLDRVKSTRTCLVVKITIEELSNIPISLIVVETDDFQPESLTIPVVIIEQNILGGGPPDEDPILIDGNTHPLPNI